MHASCAVGRWPRWWFYPQALFTAFLSAQCARLPCTSGQAHVFLRLFTPRHAQYLGNEYADTCFFGIPDCTDHQPVRKDADDCAQAPAGGLCKCDTLGPSRPNGRSSKQKITRSSLPLHCFSNAACRVRKMIHRKSWSILASSFVLEKTATRSTSMPPGSPPRPVHPSVTRPGRRGQRDIRA